MAPRSCGPRPWGCVWFSEQGSLCPRETRGACRLLHPRSDSAFTAPRETPSPAPAPSKARPSARVGRWALPPAASLAALVPPVNPQATSRGVEVQVTFYWGEFSKKKTQKRDPGGSTSRSSRAGGFLGTRPGPHTPALSTKTWRGPRPAYGPPFRVSVACKAKRSVSTRCFPDSRGSRV